MASTDQSPLELKASRDKDWREEDVTKVYQEVCKAYHSIDDFRSKLLGLLPLGSGTSIFFLLKDAFTNPTKVILSTRYHKIVPRIVRLSQRESIAAHGTNLR